MKVILITSIFISSSAMAGVAAMDLQGKPISSAEVITNGKNVYELVAKDNTKIIAAPKSIWEFTEEGYLKLYRGSVLLENNKQTFMRTSGGKVDFRGRSLVSYDAKEKSSSVFVLDGEARLINPADETRSLRLSRFQGATLEVGEVLPQLTRQLELSGLESWMKGYAWPQDKVKELLHGLPEVFAEAAEPAPKHLAETKLEDYFSSIDTADEFSQPNYYEEKFKDPDVAMLESKNKKEGMGLSPEDAALISLPNTKIDLGMDILTPAKRQEEIYQSTKPKVAKSRSLASVHAPVKKKPVVTEAQVSDGLDPEVKDVLQRLKEIRPSDPVISGAERFSSPRGPASVPSVNLVPDPVNDYSQNF